MSANRNDELLPRPIPTFTYRWPGGNEERFESGWEIDLPYQGEAVTVRYGLARRPAYGRERVRGVAWVKDSPIVEGVAEDDYESTRCLLSIVRRPDNKHGRSLSEVPAQFRGYELVSMTDRIRAPGCPRSMAARIREDDVTAWARLAIARLEVKRTSSGSTTTAQASESTEPDAAALIEETSFIGASDGLQALLELEQGLDRDALSRNLRAYDATTSYDRSLSRLRTACPAGVDPHDPAHRDVLLRWLRDWGCRHLRKEDNATSSAALAEWADTWLERLPGESAGLADLGDDGLRDAAIAFGALSASPAAIRRLKKRDVVVRFGPTAAAKALYAIRPNAFPPWDDPIRDGLGLSDKDAAYLHYLKVVRTALARTADRLGVPVSRVPAEVGRNDSSPPKIIDEYLWIRITRGGASGE